MKCGIYPDRIKYSNVTPIYKKGINLIIDHILKNIRNSYV